ncbi:Phage portal protein, lambda family [Pseudovibrio sp. Ad13]|uniref:phage portal protein n=1 Tax=Pseudovibrio sp. Ad13 TaxID=989396 RepID=UPI0007AE572C|nr:phage portal protein [Pseudovibrio sp. Ad13]KZK83599.1 Phage portal protein, lambda family [Pseudovibrio sp. Ad13]
MAKPLKALGRLLNRGGKSAPPEQGTGQVAVRSVSRYLRDTRSKVLATRPAPLTNSRDDIRLSWRRCAGLARDIIQNSGRLKGAVDQVIADTVGSELLLNPKPDLHAAGYDAQETADWCRLVKQRWKRFAWNQAECDMRGKFTLPQLVDCSLRDYITFGEVTGMLDYMGSAQRARYGIKAGTKLCLFSPQKLVQDTLEHDRLFQGVYHDENGRPISYLIEEARNGQTVKTRYNARDLAGRAQVLHIFDPTCASDVRGISVLASAFRKHIQHEMLEDATLQTAILQTLFAAVLKSELPSEEAFAAIDAMQDTEAGKEFKDSFSDYLLSTLDKSAENSVHLGSDPTVSHIAPGEDFEIKTAGTPGPHYLPFSGSLGREMARAIGITYGGLTMDYSNATYSSVRMENASIWPVVTRRRERIAAPTYQAVYESWLDEEIGEERIPFKGGYEAYSALREEASWAQWQGPAKPTADDAKSAKASSTRLENGTSSLAHECSEMGIDEEELFEQRLSEHRRYLAEGMRSPYERVSSQATAPNTDEAQGAADE